MYVNPFWMEQEQAYLAAIQASTRYDLTAGRLTLRQRRRRYPGRPFPQPVEYGGILLADRSVPLELRRS
jgi:hypothetical protein